MRAAGVEAGVGASVGCAHSSATRPLASTRAAAGALPGIGSDHADAVRHAQRDCLIEVVAPGEAEQCEQREPHQKLPVTTKPLELKAIDAEGAEGSLPKTRRPKPAMAAAAPTVRKVAERS